MSKFIHSLFSAIPYAMRLFLCGVLLFEQTAAMAGPALPRKPFSHTVAQQAAADNTAVHFANAFEKRIKEVENASAKANQLDASARQALKSGNYDKFWLLENQLNDFLISLLHGSFIKNRLYAVQMLTANIREGLLPLEKKRQVFSALENILRSQKQCTLKDDSKTCEVIGLAALALALSIEPGTDALQLKSENFSSGNAQTQKQHLIKLYSSLLLHNYGSPEANNAVGKYLVYALGYVGGAAALAQAEEALIIQSKRVPVLWGKASVPAGDWHLNRYDVVNLPVQIALFEALGAMGESAKPVLQYYASEKRSLVSFTRANIELAYLGQTSVPVKNNLHSLYCYQNWNLNSDLDFKLKKDLAYAFGEGRTPSYFKAEKDNTCQVIVPQGPNPYLRNRELTTRIMGEVIFNVALIGTGELFNALLKARHLKLALKAQRGARSAAVEDEVLHLAKTQKVPARQPVLQAAPAEPRVLVAASETAPSSNSFKAPRVIDNVPGVHTSLDWRKEHLLVKISDAKMQPSLNIAQRSHLNYLEKSVAQQPATAFGLRQAEHDFTTIADRKESAFVVFGPKMENYAFLEEEIGETFLTGRFGRQWNGRNDVFGQTLGELVDKFLEYGKTSEHVFVRWEAHGNAVNKTGKWLSWLGEETYVNMESIATTMQLVMQNGATKTITLFLDSCFPGSAFDDFLRLPAELRKNINLFATGGNLELNYSFPLALSYSNISPLNYARKIWEEKIMYQGGTGRAYINGQIFRPLDEAISYNQRIGGEHLPALRALRDLSDATTPQALERAAGLLEELHIPIYNRASELPSYIFLFPSRGRIINRATYEGILPDPIKTEIFKGLERLSF